MTLSAGYSCNRCRNSRPGENQHECLSTCCSCGASGDVLQERADLGHGDGRVGQVGDGDDVDVVHAVQSLRPCRVVALVAHDHDDGHVVGVGEQLLGPLWLVALQVGDDDPDVRTLGRVRVVVGDRQPVVEVLVVVDDLDGTGGDARVRLLRRLDGGLDRVVGDLVLHARNRAVGDEDLDVDDTHIGCPPTSGRSHRFRHTT